MTTGFDRVFEFAPQFGKYQLLVFILGYIASATIYGKVANITFVVSEDADRADRVGWTEYFLGFNFMYTTML